MTKGFGFLGAVIGVMLAGSAIAQIDPSFTTVGTEEHGFQLGLRSGYGIPLGSAFGLPPGQTGSTDLKDGIKGMIPIWADVGYRFDPNWYLGGFFQFGIGLLPSNSGCTGGVSCSENDLRFGLNIHYHFLPAESLDPWVGVGAGYEILNIKVSQGGSNLSTSLRGFEFGNLQLGLDFKLGPTFAIGPFAAFTIAQYSEGSATVGGTTQSASIDNKKIHEWLVFGLRGVFNLNID